MDYLVILSVKFHIENCCDYGFLVPTRQRGNAVCTAPAVLDDALDSVATSKRWTLARPHCIPTLARGNEKNGTLFTFPR
jgi:hypothetical protein